MQEHVRKYLKLGGAYDTYGTYRAEDKYIEYFGGETCKRQHG